MAQNNALKSFIRIDASGRDVPGSNILRKSMPKTGRWKEVPAYLCCGPFTLVTSTPADVTLTGITFTLSCGATVVAVNDITPAAATTNIGGVVDALNAAIPFYGRFLVNGSTIELEVKPEIKESLCAEGVLTFVITQTA